MSAFNLDHLRVFYERLFPYGEMVQWLSYGDADTFFRREFSFTLANDVYVRYLTFQNVEEFRERVKKDQPHKIDIGAVYSCAAKDHVTVSASKFKPLQRELVFDVDLDDYQELQVGQEKSDNIWAQGTWGFMATAIKVVDRALREDLGFQHILWVFSGRRGVHCWVCDEAARALEDSQRTAVVGYLSVLLGGICQDAFNSTFLDDENQGLLKDEARWKRFLDLIPEDTPPSKVFSTLKADLANAWSKDGGRNSAKRWQQFELTLESIADKPKTLKSEADKLRALRNQMILFHCYPRLDENVSIHRNHLLKSPFVVHPKTGKVCVPIFDVKRCHEFDPNGVPTLGTLIEELDQNKGTHRLAEYIARFEREFLTPMREAREAEASKKAKLAKRENDEKMAAVTGNW